MTIRLKPSQMTSIRQRQEAALSPYRLAHCSKCGWRLAARSVDELKSESWHVPSDPNAYLCATCDAEKPETLMTLLPAGAIAAVDWDKITPEDGFKRVPRAPENPFPKVGGRGERHFQTSRPVSVPVQKKAEA